MARQARIPLRPRPPAAILAAAVCAVALAGAPAAFGDVSTPVLIDPAGDSGNAVDLVSNQFIHRENDAGTAADDQLAVTSILDNAGSGARFTNGDLVGWYLDTDGNPSTGGFRGAEVVIALFGQAGGAEPSVQLQRWNGSQFVFVRSLGPGEVLISERVTGTLGAVAIQIPRTEVGVPRGSSLGIAVSADWLPTDESDDAPDTGQYTLAIPPNPEAPAVTPAASTAAAGESSLTFSATVDPRGLPTTYRFQYGPTPAYGSETAAGDAGAGTGGTVVSSTAAGLAASTTYHYRVVATNAAGTTFGPDQTAATAAPSAPAQTGQATAGGSRSVRLTGVVSTRGAAGTAYFEWGTSRSRLTRRTPRRPVAGDGVAVQAVVSGLAGSRTYHYRLVLETPGGRAVGQTLAVTTRPADQILADIEAPLGLLPDSRLFLRALTARVRIVNPATGRTRSARSALRRARIDVQCTRGCRMSRGIRLQPGSVRVAPIGGSAGDFYRAGAGSSGRVAIRVPAARARVAVNLLPLFTNGRGNQYLFRQGAEIVVRLSGPGLTPSATKIIVSSNARKLRCSVRGQRAVACRAA